MYPTVTNFFLSTNFYGQYWCPSIPHFRHGNVQSVVLLILYTILISGIVVRWEPRYHPKSASVLWGGDGRLILQHLLHLNSLVFITRTTHACGDLIYSGHVGCTLICMAVLHRHGYLKSKSAAFLVWVLAVIGFYFTISCRSHYSVDVVLAFYFGYFLPEWYFNRSDGRVKGRISKWIRRLEVRPNDLVPSDGVECQCNDNQNHSSSINCSQDSLV
jgi:hypothetical protein